jgi:UDP-galactopyranose mutase
MSKTKNILVVGAGFYGSIFANELLSKGYKVTIIDKRSHIGGNCYTEKKDDIDIHKYGPHIFHTNDEAIWNWINNITEIQPYIFSPVAEFENTRYSLPFNMWTFNQIYGKVSPNDVKRLLSEENTNFKSPKNLEEKAISLVGEKVYKILIKGYTEKQWGQKATELPANIITRLPVRLTYNTNYFNDKFQGIPLNGYTEIFEKLLIGVDLRLNVDYRDFVQHNSCQWDYTIYTGPIDEFFDYKYGKLDYRSLKWKNKHLEIPNFQGNSVVNFTSENTPFTRIIEHKHFLSNPKNKISTIISEEYPQDYDGRNEPYYPLNNSVNNKKFQLYKEESQNLKNIHFGGRLGSYKYYDMHQVIGSALKNVQMIEKFLLTH